MDASPTAPAPLEPDLLLVEDLLLLLLDDDSGTAFGEGTLYYVLGGAVDRLVERGFLRREKKKVLGLFTTTRLPAARPDYEKGLLDRARAVLVDGADADERTAALVALLSASGTLPQFHKSIAWSGDVYTRGKQLENGNWAAQAVNLAVTRTAGATASSIVF